MRAEALQSMRNNFEFLETMMSSEGKKRKACDTAKRKLSDPPVIERPEAAKRIISSDFHGQKLLVDESGVKKRADVEVGPIGDHSGRKTREIGELVSLTHQEVMTRKKHPEWRDSGKSTPAALELQIGPCRRKKRSCEPP